MYGVTLYFSSNSDGCDEENDKEKNERLIQVVVAFELFIIVLRVLVSMIYALGVLLCCSRSNERQLVLLYFLTNFQYDFKSHETDGKCLLCFKYTDDD